MRSVRLVRRPDSWAGFFALDDTTEVPADFMDADGRGQLLRDRDPFEGIGDLLEAAGVSLSPPAAFSA